MKVQGSPVVYTVGHSNRHLREFLDMLLAFRIEIVADIRTIPRSRHNPQFNIETLPGELNVVGIDYVHVKGLGGLRRPEAGSTKNSAWKNASFRGFADYMQSEEFEKNLEELLRSAGKKRLALMCAEAVPWRCHRYLIADALLARGVDVLHITSARESQPHRMNTMAQVAGHAVTYPAAEIGKKSSAT
jgi:uncharacterized protein (DUF488 family)